MDYQNRVVLEMASLNIKIFKLEKFTNSDKFNDVNKREQDLLTLQLTVMKQYAAILSERVNLHQ